LCYVTRRREEHKSDLLPRLTLALLLGLVLGACNEGKSETRPTATPPSDGGEMAAAVPPNTPTSPGQREAIERGRGLYFSQGCYVCHGERGEGDVGPTLASTSLSFAEVRRQLRNPRGFMPAYIPEILSDDHIRDLYTFERSLPRP